MKIKKGDTVQVTTGNDAGKTGRVIKVFMNILQTALMLNVFSSQFLLV